MGVDTGLRSSRRLTGPSLYLDEQGVAIDAPLVEDIDRTVRSWRAAVRAMWHDLGWEPPRTGWRDYPGGVTLAASAPEDVLYTACDAHEAAWAVAVEAQGFQPPGRLPQAELERLAAAERSPRRLAIAAAAAAHGVRFFADDELLSVGSGGGARVWPVENLPSPEEIDWSRVRDVPTALVTGTNGKTTTVRMLAAVVAAAGLVPGNTSTDGVQIDGRFVLEGDYTGGEGARRVLQDPKVDVALLEVARGGMLRRGLPVNRADAAYVSNVGNDHLGEYGIDSLADLALVKLLVAKAVESPRDLVLNGDDPSLAAHADESTIRVSLEAPENATAFCCQRGRLGLQSGGTFAPWIEVAEIPSTLAGAAVHNVYNALGTMAVAHALGIARAAICEGLATFRSDAITNPGRGNVFRFDGVDAIVDFAHNPEGFERVLQMATRLGARRVAILVGQAGDRDDSSIEALAAVCADASPDLVVIKEMERYLRGRAPGEVAQRIRAGLLAGGLAPDHVVAAPSEVAGVRHMLQWAAEGDVLLLLAHAERAAVLRLMSRLNTDRWKPGTPLPAELEAC